MSRFGLAAVLLLLAISGPVVARGGTKAAQRFNIVCAVDRLVGNERMIASNHDPIPEKERVEYSVDLEAERFQEHYPPNDFLLVRPIAEINDRDVYLTRNSELFVAFRRRDLLLVQAYQGPDNDVRVMAGPCRKTTFTPFRE